MFNDIVELVIIVLACVAYALLYHRISGFYLGLSELLTLAVLL